ncbi:MAG: c-type cytochrome [Rubripirellula sp.]|nr:c-type cytochrome [Rubripirellula sp.]
MLRSPNNSSLLFLLPLLLLPVLMMAGCERVERPAVFDPNLVLTMKYQITEDIPMEDASQDSTWIVEKMFGTPDDPKLPEVMTEDESFASIVSMDRLQQASGPADAEGRGLFRKHCALCHGVSGNGRGPSAAVQNPYPRDFRMGKFKFNSTPGGVKPTREDLAGVIRNGIGGTAMKKINELTEEDIQALVDYVIYLSIRGEHERQQINIAMMDGILEDGTRLLNTQFASEYFNQADTAEQLETLAEKDEDSLSEAETERLEAYEKFEEDWEYAKDYVADIAESWLEAEEEALQVPEPPTGFPLAESREDIDAFRASDQAAVINESIQRGRELFVGKVANCSKCHGEKGLGDGQTTDFDDWTKDWTLKVGLKPDEREKLIPLLARGAMLPRNAIPRNFAEGVFRGGSSSNDLYRRITQGIDGTPMPAATFVEGQFEKEDVWHLINFMRSLQKPAEPLESVEPSPQA